jgi:HNH endonuclease
MMAGLLSEPSLSFFLHSVHPFSAWILSKVQIQPVSRGGKTAEDNLALACQTCNNYKHTKTEAFDPVTNELVPLFHPRQMLWHEHFSWNDDVTQMMGNTPIGRTTINLLRTNRESVMNIRRVLAIMGFHPSD